MSDAPEYVLARRVLLDALGALAEQREAVVLVGAQAIYLHVGEADLAVPVMTTDGDLAVDPGRLHDAPRLQQAMESAGFVATQPGSWRGHSGVMIDLMVPEAVAARPGRRGADLGVHGTSVARQTRGLEAALVDRELHTIGALDPSDVRSFDVAVASPAALLCAKLHKIAERAGTKRAEDKDALDVLRLLRATDPAAVGERLAALTRDPRCGPVVAEAVEHFRALFATHESTGPTMAARAAFPAEPAEAISRSAAILAARVLRAV